MTIELSDLVTYIMESDNVDKFSAALEQYLQKNKENAVNDIFNLEMYAPVYSKDGEKTLLMHAAAYDRAAIIDLLISRGADIAWRNQKGKCALDEAILKQNASAGSSLLNCGAELGTFFPSCLISSFNRALAHNHRLEQRAPKLGTAVATYTTLTTDPITLVADYSCENKKLYKMFVDSAAEALKKKNVSRKRKTTVFPVLR